MNSDFKFSCPHCEHPLVVSTNMFGQQVNCPSCYGKIVLSDQLCFENIKMIQSKQSKQCLFCGETILKIALKCKHCGEILNNSAIINNNTNQKTQNLLSSEKRILPMFILYLFFGSIGIHSVYAGRFGQCIIYVSLFCLSFILPLYIQLGLFHPIICLMYIGVLISDFIAIVSGRYIDNEGLKINKWT